MMAIARSTDSAKRPRRPAIVTVLDLGSTKTVCLIARMVPCEEGRYLHGRTHAAEVIGLGHVRSLGVKSGVIVDLDAAERAIRHAVEAAERMAGVTVDSMIVNLSGGRPQSGICSAAVALRDRPVSQREIDEVQRLAVKRASRLDRHVMHLIPVDHTLDGERGIVDPRGMIGNELTLNMHLVAADAAPVRNLELAINRAHLSIETLVATPYASGLSTLVDDELELGCACVDMGGGTTSLSIFAERRFVHTELIPVGGHHVTMDIARGLNCRLDDAERLKVMHGSVIATSVDDRDMIQIASMDEEDARAGHQVPRSLLNRIIAARVEETLEMLRERIDRSGYSSVVGKRVILTGGAAQLGGLADLARRVLGRNGRIGRPLGVRGLPAAAKGPAFATAVGLMIYPQVADSDHSTTKFAGGASLKRTGTEGPLGRMTQWIKESF
ncbi:MULTISPECIES: cell division protein FtsA [unclassified Roseitalea]|uniref:cell division protein FtsA n=1 Tax=unclassified Roseitalea TaxID=2639107 RepID=UPI00273FAB4B|nr:MULTISPECIES: cell division protein FtsA [unclassified Roseitalea]